MLGGPHPSIAAVCVLAVLVATLGISQPASKPPCPRVNIALEDDIDSAHALADDAFRFVTVNDVQLIDGTVVPAGSIGQGLIAISQHAERGGRGGYLVIEARYIALHSGSHVPAAIDWAAATRATATGASLNIPGIVGAIPFMGYLLGPYAFIHHGKDVIIPRGAQLPVVLGDDLAAGTCRLVVPSPEPSPSVPQTTAPSPAPSADATTPPDGVGSTSTPSPTPVPSATPVTLR